MIVAGPLEKRPAEVYEYVPMGAERLYVVHHRAKGSPRGIVVIGGATVAQRERAYRSMVLLARTIAGAGFDAVRFDYRGVGESTGSFAERSLCDWREDLEAVASIARSWTPRVPMVMMGLRTGALLASQCFARGIGDAMLLLSPPRSGTDLLQEILRRTLMADMLASPNAPRRTREEIAAALERGEIVNVDGYAWSRKLWESAPRHELMLPGREDHRPWFVVDFKGTPATPMPKGAEPRRSTIDAERFWESSPILIPRTTALFELVLARLAEAEGGSRAA